MAVQDDARFCPACGASLQSQSEVASELKVITTLFADLVGFTALGERHDPEDIDRALRSYFTMARDVIERRGGLVEKFIGDAVVGVFGVPLAREDEAERAVRAALEIVAGVAGLPRLDDERLQVRVGVNTGKALVRPCQISGSSEGVLVGDVMNTGARLQTLAPPGGVTVGEVTHALTAGRIAYQPLPPQTVKGKKGPLPCWLATGPATSGDTTGLPATPFAGREIELGLLGSLLDRAQASSMPHHVLLTGEAGIGKSRLLREFALLVQRRPAGLVVWRHGQCPAYGDDGGFLALAEILRAHTGVNERDGDATAAQKLTAALRDYPERQWMEHHLRPLLGLSGAAASRPENFAAWSSFLKSLGGEGLAVIVFEDLHWASEATLDFLRYLMLNAAPARLLVVSTGRPGLAASHPSFVTLFNDVVSPAARTLHLHLEPLSAYDCECMVRRTCDALGDEAPDIARRSGGNPLFVEELVRFLSAAPDEHARRRLVDDAGLPESLQALIAARLDALDPPTRTAASDAAVFGPRFWKGAVAAVGGRTEGDLDAALRNLVLQGLVRERVPSSLPGQTEFSFAHSLIRDVAYGLLTRRRRALRHQAAATWIESLHGQPTRELAEFTARHYSTALRLAQAARDPELAETLTGPCAHALATSARMTLPLDVQAGERQFAEAAALLPADDRDRPALLSDWGEALSQSGDLPRSAEVLEKALAQQREVDDIAGSVRTMIRLARAFYLMGDVRHEEMTRAALAMSEDGPRGPEWLAAKAHWCFLTAASFLGEPAVAAANDAILAYEELGEEPAALVYGYRGMARCDLGDPGGIDDLRRALRSTRRRGFGYESSVLSYDLADALHVYQGPRPALRLLRSAVGLAMKRGDDTSARYLRAMSLFHLSYAGHWDAALAGARDLMPELQRHSQAGDFVEVAVMSAYLDCMRGDDVDPDTLRTTCDALLPAGPEEIMSYRIHLAWTHLASGDADRALDLLEAAADIRDGFGCPLQTGMSMPLALAAAWQAGDPELAARFARGVPETRAIDRNVLLAHEAHVAQTTGDLESAAAGYAAEAAAWHDFGTPFEEARAQVARAGCLLELGRPSEARAPLVTARRILRRLGARPLLTLADRLAQLAAG